MTTFEEALLEVESQDSEWLSLFPLMQGHYELMVRWNPIHNLTRDIQPERAALLHYRDSFLGLCALRDRLNSNPKSVYDVGSGGGFPALFLPHFFPTAKIAWVEKVSKKASFLRTVAGALDLNVEVLQQDVFKCENVELMTSRATFPWAKLTELSKTSSACVGFVATEPSNEGWKDHVEGEGLVPSFQNYDLREHQRALACWSSDESFFKPTL